jgi:hypothetical protein
VASAEAAVDSVAAVVGASGGGKCCEAPKPSNVLLPHKRPGPVSGSGLRT